MPNPVHIIWDQLLKNRKEIPFIMNWPGIISAGTVFYDPVSFLEVAPTFLANAGGSTNKLEGTNLISYLKQINTDLAGRQLKWRFTIIAAIREGKWKLVRLPIASLCTTILKRTLRNYMM